MSSEDVSTERLTQKPLAAALGEERREELAVVLAGHRLVDEADAVLVEEGAVAVARVDDHEARLVVGEVALDERQRPPADRAEADHHDRSVDLSVDGPGGHGCGLLDERGASGAR